MRAPACAIVAVLAAGGCGRRNFNVDGAVDPTGANYVFVTAGIHDGALGGLAGADAFCTDAALAAGLSGQFVAWLSTTETDAIDRLAGARGWVRPDGGLVADRALELTTSGPRTPIAVSETGIDLRTLGDESAFTATSANGAWSGTDCAGWTASDGNVSVGALAGGTGRFTARGSSGACATGRHLYCFGIDRDVALEVAPEPRPPLAFTSRTAWLPATGIAAADATCSDEAAAAGLAGNFRAALSTMGASTASRFSNPAVVFTRPDGRRLGTLLSSTLFDGFPNVHADGTQAAEMLVWTGGLPTLAGTTSATCANWSDPLLGADLGVPTYANAEVVFRSARATCASAFSVYCLQD